MFRKKQDIWGLVLSEVSGVRWGPWNTSPSEKEGDCTVQPTFPNTISLLWTRKALDTPIYLGNCPAASDAVRHSLSRSQLLALPCLSTAAQRQQMLTALEGPDPTAMGSSAVLFTPPGRVINSPSNQVWCFSLHTNPATGWLTEVSS